MKYVKMLGLLAAAASMAFTGSASATFLTSPSGTTYTSTISALSLHGELHGSFVTVTCEFSHVQGKVESHGTLVTVGGKLSTLVFEFCNFPVKVLKNGSLEVHTAGGSADGNGTVTSSGAEIEIKTSFGTCIFTTSNTDIGTVTGGTTAELDIDSAKIPRTGGSAGFLCGSSATWTGSYLVRDPDTLLVD